MPRSPIPPLTSFHRTVQLQSREDETLNKKGDEKCSPTSRLTLSFCVHLIFNASFSLFVFTWRLICDLYRHFISLSERILLSIFVWRKTKLKDGYTSSALKRREVFQTENKTQSKTPLYFLFLIYIICICSLNYIQQTQKNRFLTLGEINIIFYWYYELYFTEIMIPESLFTVFPNSNHKDSFSINGIIPFTILQSSITWLFDLLSQCGLCINECLFSCKEEIE